MDEFLTVNS